MKAVFFHGCNWFALINIGYWYSLLWLIFTLSCKPADQGSSSYTNTRSIPSGKSDQRILFLDLQIKTDSTNHPQLYLMNKISVKGKMPSQTRSHDNSPLLYINFLDEDKKHLTQISVVNPLQQPMEYIDQTGKLVTHIHSMDSATFSLRTSVSEKAAFIQIEGDDKLINLNSLQ